MEIFLATLDGKSTIRLWNMSENEFKTLDVQAISMDFSVFSTSAFY